MGIFLLSWVFVGGPSPQHIEDLIIISSSLGRVLRGGFNAQWVKALLGDMEHFDVLRDNKVCVDLVRWGKTTAASDEERSWESTVPSTVAWYLGMYCLCQICFVVYIHILHRQGDGSYHTEFKIFKVLKVKNNWLLHIEKAFVSENYPLMYPPLSRWFEFPPEVCVCVCSCQFCKPQTCRRKLACLPVWTILCCGMVSSVTTH